MARSPRTSQAAKAAAKSLIESGLTQYGDTAYDLRPLAATRKGDIVRMAKLRFYYMAPPDNGEQVAARVKALLATPTEVASGLVGLLDKYIKK